MHPLPVQYDTAPAPGTDQTTDNVKANSAATCKAYVYANGPSGRAAPKHRDGLTVALNGALSLFADPFRPADLWMACDPQGLVADFLDGGHARAYMPATKCHPTVYRKLMGDGALILPWNVGDVSMIEHPDLPVIMPAASITTTAIGKLYREGKRDITVYGWDCCYLDGKHHAFDQEHWNDDDTTVMVGEDVFHTTHTWAHEVHDAMSYIAAFCPDLSLTVVGPGMVGAIMRYRQVSYIKQ